MEVRVRVGQAVVTSSHKEVRHVAAEQVALVLEPAPAPPLPRAFLWTAASALTVFVFLLGGAGKRGLWVASLYAIVAGALAGAGLAALRAPRTARPPGPPAVLELSYGSGTDRHRPEFGAKAALRSRSVDGSLLVERWKGALGWARKAYLGFDAKHLPLQGRVWYPGGEGPL